LGLLGHVLSLKAGVRYGQLVKARILTMLSMNSTGIAMNSTQITTPLPDMLKSRLVKGHIDGREVAALRFFQKQFRHQEHFFIPLQMTY
jgi:serine-type D-Ala-D-Ala carboxypeptidase/endopeptidase